MIRPVPGRLAAVFLMLVLMWISLACVTLTGGTPAASQATGEPPSVEVNIDFGPGPFDFPDTRAGLADLPSYKATLTRSFEGTRDGKALKWSKTYVMLSAQEPAALQLTIEKTGDLPDLDPIFMAEADGVDYGRSGENGCNANVVEVGNSLRDRLEPAAFLTFVIGAEEAGAETVNGTAAKHYTFDERAFGQPSAARSTGEMWVASEGGYIVKYALTTKGGAESFGDGVEGTLVLEYLLTDVNKPVTVILPEDCPAGMVDAPQLPDASNVLSIPGLVTYDTASSLTDASAFYQAQMPGLGWQALDDPIVSDDRVLLQYTREDEQIQIVINPGENGATSIYIVLSRVQKK